MSLTLYSRNESYPAQVPLVPIAVNVSPPLQRVLPIIWNKTSTSALQVLFKTAKSSEVAQALYKSEGYFSRLFSNETWGQWWENKSPLGKVRDAYNEHLMDLAGYKSNPISLDSTTLSEANQQAEELLSSKLTSLLTFSFPGALAQNVSNFISLKFCSPQEAEEIERKTDSLKENREWFHVGTSLEDILNLLTQGDYSESFDEINPKTIAQVKEIMDLAKEIFELKTNCFSFISIDTEILNNLISKSERFDAFYEEYSYRSKVLEKIDMIENEIENYIILIQAEREDQMPDEAISELEEEIGRLEAQNEFHKKQVRVLNAALTIGFPIALERGTARQEDFETKKAIKEGLQQSIRVYKKKINDCKKKLLLRRFSFTKENLHDIENYVSQLQKEKERLLKKL